MDAAWAAVLTVVTVRIGPEGADHVAAVSRVIQGIIAGVGFLGGGAILKSEHEMVHGLTTAASIWLVASLGIACGAGQWAAALTALSGGGDVNWEGAAGSEDFDANGDVRGSYEVWGVNSTFQIFRVAFIPDSSIPTSGFYGAQGVAMPQASFLQVQAVGDSRRH